MKRSLPLSLVVAFSGMFGCAAPRAVIWDGTSVEQGHVEGHLGMVGNVPTATLGALGNAQMDAVDRLLSDKSDSLTDPELYRSGTRSLVAAGLDMPGMNTVASLHLGLGWGLEAGYRREGGANAWSLRWQFLSAKNSGWNAGVGVQYSSSEYELPSALGDLQSVLGYKFERKDIEVPVVFSRPFGDDGEYGSGGFGVVGAWTGTRYGFDPEGLYRKWGGTVAALERLPDQESSFFSYGAVGFVRFGYKYVWCMTGVTVLYQDYGSYKVPSRDPVELSGFTVLPAIGLEFRI